eukprot:Awhi_evm1s12848
MAFKRTQSNENEFFINKRFFNSSNTSEFSSWENLNLLTLGEAMSEIDAEKPLDKVDININSSKCGNMVKAVHGLTKVEERVTM